MKDCQTPTTLNQGTPTLFHDGKHINDPEFDLEDSFCARLNKIRAVGDMFHVMGGAHDCQFTSEGAFGIYELLEDTAEELRAICYKMLENQEVTR